MRHRGAILFSVAALVVSLMGFGVICQNYYRVSLWMAAYDQKRIEADRRRMDSDAKLIGALNKISDRLGNR